MAYRSNLAGMYVTVWRALTKIFSRPLAGKLPELTKKFATKMNVSRDFQKFADQGDSFKNRVLGRELVCWMRKLVLYNCYFDVLLI